MVRLVFPRVEYFVLTNLLGETLSVKFFSNFDCHFVYIYMGINSVLKKPKGFRSILLRIVSLNIRLIYSGLNPINLLFDVIS